MIDIQQLELDTEDLFTAHTHTCVECGASYQTCNPRTGGRCSRCIVTRLGAPAATAARITCRVCGAQASVPLDHPALLCALCLSDLDATRDRVAGWRTAALERLGQVQHVWEAERNTSAALAQWGKVQAALIAVAEKRATQAQLDATWAKRKAEGGALAQLLLAYEAYARECDRIAEELERLHQAQTQINTAHIATEV